MLINVLGSVHRGTSYPDDNGDNHNDDNDDESFNKYLFNKKMIK